MVDIDSLNEGDAVEHNDTGAIREVSGFIKDFSGERGAAKLERNRRINHAVGKSEVNEGGHTRLERGDGDEWALLEVDVE